MKLSAPTPLIAEHDTAAFSCGQISLDDWLKRRALGNQKTGASRTFVVTSGNRVVAYYALASGALACTAATGKLRHNMPDPIPMAILGRLAIDLDFQGKGLGRAMFSDAVLRILGAADVIGIRGMLVHAIPDEAAAFYQALGLEAAPTEPRMLMITLTELQTSL